MTLIRRSASLATWLLSILGLLLCVAGIVAVWAGMSRLATLEAAVFGTADEALVFMEQKLAQVKVALENGRERVNVIAKRAERLREAGADIAQETGPLLESIRDMFDELKSTEHWLDSAQAIAQGVTRVSTAIASSDAVAQRGEPAVAVAGQVRDFSQDLADVIAKLQAVRQEIIEMRENREIAREIAARVVNRLVEVNGRLEHSAARVGELHARVLVMQADCDDIAGRVHMWITATASALTAVLGWFAVSQVGMMGHARRMVRSGAAGGT